MATMPSVEEFKDYTRNEKPTDDDAVIEAALAAAVQTMNDECQDEFVVAGTPAARTFVPERYSDLLRVGSFVSLTSVVENGTTLTLDSGFQCEPVSRVNHAGQSVPYNTLARLDRRWYTHGRRGTVVVTAAWGWPAIPVRVAEAVKILTKDLIANRDVQLGIVAFTDAAAVGARTNPVVRATIEAYRTINAYLVA